MTAHPDIEQFNRTVWSIVRQVPNGIVTTYGQIASMIPRPPEVDETDYEKLSPRWVGDAMNAVSRADNKNIPWWRVINSRGGVSLKPETQAGTQQRTRLKREGVKFDEKELVDFAAVGWTGPDDDWLAEHGLMKPKPLIPDEPPPSDDNPQQLSLF